MTPARFLGGHEDVALVRVASVAGSAPREAGAWMLVAGDAVLGSIGGGQLEWMALDAAREVLSGAPARKLDVPLGPEIGQCCGGRVTLTVARLDAAGRDRFLAEAEAAACRETRVLIFGAGHVGRALAGALLPLPVRPVLIDSRANELAAAPDGVETRLTALPEAEVRVAPPGAAYLVVTHDHALDFLLVAEALRRGDAAHVGMIGSATKRARAERFLRSEGLDPAPLVCPIGGATGDKRPAVIAALTAAELLQRLSTRVSQEA